MSAIVLVCLAVQSLALLAMQRFGGGLTRRLGGVFVAFCFVFHGATEVTAALFPDSSFYRQLLNSDEIDSWVPIATIAICLFVGAYLFVSRAREHLISVSSTAKKISISWPFLISWFVPLYILAISGRLIGFGYWLSGFTEYLVPFGLVLISMKASLEVKSRLVPIVVVLLTVVSAMFGQRLPVVLSIVSVLFVLTRYRSDVSLAGVTAGLVFSVFLILSISGARSVVGREALTNIGSERAKALAAGAAEIASSTSDEQSIRDDFVYRIDGNAFPAMIYSRIKDGIQAAGMEPVVNSITMAVPSAFFEGKTDRPIEMLVEKAYLESHFFVPSGFDYLPTTFGAVLGCFGLVGLLLGATVLGAFMSVVDGIALKEATAPGFLIATFFLYCIVYMERGLGFYFIALRSILFVSLAWVIVHFFVRQVRGIAGEWFGTGNRRRRIRKLGDDATS